jgi:hypothetical protein
MSDRQLQPIYNGFVFYSFVLTFGFMSKLHPEVSQYLEGLPDWSRKICTKLRSIIRAADDSIQEEWKWGPHYSSTGMVCGYGAFQKHVKLTFFNGSGMKDPKGLFNHCIDNEFSRSIKLVTVEDIDADSIRAYVRESVSVNKKGFKREVREKTVIVPKELTEALRKNKKAGTFFESLSYGYRKEYAEYIDTAKQEKTRMERAAKVVALCGEGRKLNDKYKR